ncbi:MAG: hypothetical protein AAF492_08550, partial [Verrucomicrobiota bacterium]
TRVLANRADGPSLAEIEIACQHPDVRVRRAALDALSGYHSWQLEMAATAIPSLTVSTQFMPYIQAVIDNTNAALWEIDGALLTLVNVEPADNAARRPFIESFLDHEEWWLRRSATLALTEYPSEVPLDSLMRLADVYQREGIRDPANAFSWGMQKVINANGTAFPLTSAQQLDFVQRVGHNIHYPVMVGPGLSFDPQLTFYVHTETSLDLLNAFNDPTLYGDLVDQIVQFHFHVGDVQIFEWKARQIWDHLGEAAITNGSEWIAQILKDVLSDAEMILPPLWGEWERNTLTVISNVTADLLTYESAHGPIPAFGPPPVPVASDKVVVDEDGDGQVRVFFDGRLSFDPDGPILAYAWERDHTPLGYEPTNSLTLPLGTNRVTLRVTDHQAQFVEKTVTTIVLPDCQTNTIDGPIASIASNPVVRPSGIVSAPIQITLDGTGSSDPDGTIVHYIWKTGSVVVANGPQPTVSLGPGVHAFSLLVVDNDGKCDQFDLAPFTLEHDMVANTPGPLPRATAALLRGSFFSTEPSTVVFYWGPVDGQTNPANWSSSRVLTSPAPGEVSTTLAGLTMGQTFFYRLLFTNSTGSLWAENTTNFTTLEYSITNLPPVPIHPNSAEARADFNGPQLGADLWLHYGPVDGGADAQLWSNAVYWGRASDAVNLHLHRTIPDLIAATGYHYTWRAVGPDEEVWATPSTPFTTLPPAYAVTNLPAVNIRPISASVQGVFENGSQLTADLWLHHGPIDGGTDASQWDHAVFYGSLTNVSHVTLDATIDNLPYLAEHFYTWRATRPGEEVWATPSRSFTTISPINNQPGPSPQPGAATLRGTLLPE